MLPAVCGQSLRRWWAVWAVSWPVAAAGMVWWLHDDLDVGRAAVAAALLLGLPGVLGPRVVIPVGVDLPATALALVAVGAMSAGWWWLAAPLLVAAAGVKESAPVWAALWAWSLWPLAALAVPALLLLGRRRWEGPDPLGAEFQVIADRPVRSALAARAGRWRDGWLMVAPWGVCLVALVGADWRLVAVLAVAHLQLLVATDTVRLVQHAAGPAMAAAAAAAIPAGWLVLAVAVHVFWWRTPERI